MTELSFLIDLLLNHKLPKVTRDAIATRLKDVEASLASRAPQAIVAAPRPQIQIPPHLVGQSPSTIAAMMRHEQQGGPAVVPAAAVIPGVEAPPEPAAAPQPVAVVAQTAATAQALAARQAAINIGISGKPANGEKSPRKW